MKFSSKHPILIYAAAALLGFYGGSCWTAWIFAATIPFLFLDWKRLILCASIFMTLFIYSSLSIAKLDPSLENRVAAYPFTPAAAASSKSAFGSQWIYQGYAWHEGKRFPCQIRIPKKKNSVRPPANCSYLITGKLKASHGFRYSIFPNREAPWIPIEGTFSLAEYRLHAKQKVKNFVKKFYGQTQAAEFLGGILTGDFEDQMIRNAFGRAGLQHILAISGFHFSIITAILLGLLRLFLPQKIALYALLILLCSYFVFLGCSASILRAWIMSIAVIVGVLWHKTPIALNSLGLAIFIILAVEPHLAFSIGFIFSFAVTASLLIFYPFGSHAVSYIFPYRSLNEIMQMSRLDQHSYIVVTFAKEMLALSFAVNVVAIPLALFFFGKFPLISLLYNLIIPFLVSVVMFFFIAGIFLPWLHAFNLTLTQATLDCVNNLPAPLHIHLYFSLGLGQVVCWLTFLTLIGIGYWTRTHSKDLPMTRPFLGMKFL